MSLQNNVHYTFYSVEMLNKYFGFKRPIPQDETVEEPVAPKKRKQTLVTGFDKEPASWRLEKCKVSYLVYLSGVQEYLFCGEVHF